MDGKSHVGNAFMRSVPVRQIFRDLRHFRDLAAAGGIDPFYRQGMGGGQAKIYKVFVHYYFFFVLSVKKYGQNAKKTLQYIQKYF